MDIAYVRGGQTIYAVSDGGFDRHIEYGNTNNLSHTDGAVCDLRIDSKLDAGAWDNTQSDAQELPLNSKGLNQITIHYSTWAAAPTSECKKQPDLTTSITQLQNFNITYNWISQGEIQRVDNNSSHTYKDSGQNVNYTFHTASGNLSGPMEVYFREGELDQTSCVDFMLIPKVGLSVNSEVQFAYYEELDKNGHGNASTYPGTQNDGCKIVTQSEDNTKVPQSAFIDVGNFTASRSIPTGNSPSSGGGGTNCAVTNALSFIICPFIQLADDFYTNVVQPVTLKLLNNGTLDTTSKNVANAKLVHDQFKNLTNVLFVLIFLIIIFSTTLSIGLDNYNVKKMLPRLVVAVILVQFSWVLMQLAFDVTNILAAGISSLPIFNVATAAGHIPAASYVVGAGIAALFTAGAIATGLIIPFLLMLLAAVIGILAVFLTLIIRQYLIIVLVVIAPLAFVAWVLPNTENLFKTWSKLLLRLLIMYPMIVLLFSMAGLFSKIQPAQTNGLTGIVAAVVPILAFYMVPWTFRWAGGAMAAVGGYITARASGTGKAARQSQLAKNAAEDRKRKMALQESRGGVRGYAAGVIGRGNVLGRLGAGNKFRSNIAQTAGYDNTRKRIESDASINDGDLYNFATGNYGAISSGSILNSMKGDAGAIGAVHRMIAEKGLYSDEMAASLEDNSQLSSTQKDYIYNYVRSGSGGQKMAEGNMVMAMANRSALQVYTDSDGKRKVTVDPTKLSAGASAGIKGRAGALTGRTLSQQKDHGLKMLTALGPNGIGQVTPGAITGLKAAGVSAETSDATRKTILDAINTAGTAVTQAEARATINPDGTLI